MAEATSNVTVGRHPSYNEAAALAASIDTKLFYEYQDIILMILCSFPQANVSNFLFGITREDALKRFSDTIGKLTNVEFYKLLHFVININKYIESRCAIENISDRIDPNNFDTLVFNDVQASLSIADLVCRYLFTIYTSNMENRIDKIKVAHPKANKSSKKPPTPTAIGKPSAAVARSSALKPSQKKGGMKKGYFSMQPDEDEEDGGEADGRDGHAGQFSMQPDEDEEDGEDEEDDEDDEDEEDDEEEEEGEDADSGDEKGTKPIVRSRTDDETSSAPEKKTKMPKKTDHSGDDIKITPNGLIDVMITIGNKDYITFEDDDFKKHLGVEKEEKIIKLIIDEIPEPEQLEQPEQPEQPEEVGLRRSSGRLQLLKDAARLKQMAADAAAEEKELQNKLAAQAAELYAASQLAEALSRAGKTYSGIEIIPKTFCPAEENPKWRLLNDADFCTKLAQIYCTLKSGCLASLRTAVIEDRIWGVRLLQQLGLLSYDDDDDDDADVFGSNGGGHKGGGKQGKKRKKKVWPDGFIPLKPRGNQEGRNAANQCKDAIGALSEIERIKCYICGEPGDMDDMDTMECEHIFCVGLAAQYFGILRVSGLSPTQKRILSILYAWAHRCCNQLKGNFSFMKFSANIFQFNEVTAKDLLNNIHGNTNFDCSVVNDLIQKSHKNKQLFVARRIPVLGRYCRPLIDEVNQRKNTFFRNNLPLFRFMGKLNIIAKTLLPLESGTDATIVRKRLYLKRSQLPGTLAMIFPGLNVVAAAASAGGGRKRKINKIQFGGQHIDSFKKSIIEYAIWMLNNEKLYRSDLDDPVAPPASAEGMSAEGMSAKGMSAEGMSAEGMSAKGMSAAFPSAPLPFSFRWGDGLTDARSGAKKSSPGFTASNPFAHIPGINERDFKHNFSSIDNGIVTCVNDDETPFNEPDEDEKNLFVFNAMVISHCMSPSNLVYLLLFKRSGRSEYDEMPEMPEQQRANLLDDIIYVSHSFITSNVQPLTRGQASVLQLLLMVLPEELPEDRLNLKDVLTQRLSHIMDETNPDIVELVDAEIKKQPPQRMPNIDTAGINKLVLILYPTDTADVEGAAADPHEELKYKQKIVTDICEDIKKCLSLYSKGNDLYKRFLSSLGIDITHIATFFSTRRDLMSPDAPETLAGDDGDLAPLTIANIEGRFGPSLNKTRSDSSSQGSVLSGHFPGNYVSPSRLSSAATVGLPNDFSQTELESQNLGSQKLANVEEGNEEAVERVVAEGGSSRRRLHKNRHRRRTQYTKKYKRSNSSKYYTTIKRRKLYRKHNHTIKKRKSLRQKRRN